MLTFGGVSYSIDHLDPCQRRIELPLQGGFKKTVLVEFHFSNHCYSRGPASGEVIPSDMLVMDGKRERIFDVRRYNLSHVILECIDDLIAQNGEVGYSRHNNFFQADLVQEEGADPVTFYIFMRARKEKPDHGEKRIRVQVESAYPEQPNVPPPGSDRNEAFLRILGRAWSQG